MVDFSLRLKQLRLEKHLTQAQVAERIGVTPSMVSSYETDIRLPSFEVMLRIADLFGVTVDYLLSSHDAWEKPKDEDEEEPPSYSVDTIIALALVSVMTVALTVFVTLWIIGIVEWRIFLIGISVTLLTYMVLDCVFKGARRLLYILSAFVFSLIVLVYFFIPVERPWQLFLLAIPAEIIVYLGCNIRKSPHHHRRPKSGSGS